MKENYLPSLFIFIICVILSAFFSSSETAYTSLNRLRMEHEAKQGSRAAKKALNLSQKYDKLLSTILIGNNIVNIAASSVATVFFVSLYPNYGATIATLVTTLILLLFGEITPKLIAKILPEIIAKQFASILQLLVQLFKPLVWFFTKWQDWIMGFLPKKSEVTISEAELLSIVGVANEEGSIEDEEHRLVRAAIKLDDTDIYPILTPRLDVDAIDIKSSDQEIEAVFEESNHTRLIVYDGDIDRLVGTLHERDYNRNLKRKLRHESYKSLESIIAKPHYIPTTTILSDLLAYMQENKCHLVFVIDEFGSFEGIVTMEDILERLVGNIWDEHDIVERDIHIIEEHQVIRIPGIFSLDDLYEYFDLIPNQDWDSNTVAGLIMESLNRMAEPNDQIEIDGLSFKVEKVVKGRILEVLVTKIEEFE